MSGTKRSRAVLATLGLAVGAAAIALALDLRATATRLESRVATLQERVEEVGRTVQLFRLEQQAEAGLGLPALLERIRFWGPQLDDAATPPAAIPAIEEQLEGTIGAMRELGPGVAPRLVEEFEASGSPRADSVRKWLLLALLAVDEARGEDLLARSLSALDLEVSPRIRLLAADELLQRDKARAGEILRRILRTESHRGLDRERLDPALRQRYPDAVIAPYEGWAFYVAKYAASDDPELEATLQMLLGRRNYHNFLTLQEAVKWLGELGSRDAVNQIKDLYERPPMGYTPMFRNHCLDALAQILGSEACEYFKQAMREPNHEMIRSRLAELIKANC